MINVKGRTARVILYLLERDYAVSLKKISEDTNININTLRKDMKSVADFVKEFGLNVVAKPNVGLKIEGTPEKKIALSEELKIAEEILSNSESKTWYACFLLLSSRKTPTIEDLSDILERSRPAVSSDIKKIKEWLKDFNITLIGEPGRGYVIEGSEEDIRYAIKVSIKNFFSYSFDSIAIKFGNLDRFKASDQKLLGVKVLKTAYLFEIKEFIDRLLQDLKRVLSPQDTFSFALDVYVSVERNIRGFKLSYDEKTLLQLSKMGEYSAIKNNVKILENSLKINFSDSEIAFLTKRFLGLRAEPIETYSSIAIPDVYFKKVEDIVRFAEEYLGFKVEEDPEVVRMFALHLKGAIEKIKLGVKIENPILRTIKREYTFAFDIAKKVSEGLSKSFKIEIPEEEIGYIATYIMALVESSKVPKKVKAVVICPMGIATSKILYYRLLQEFPNLDILETFSFKDAIDGKLPQEVDLIISTTHINFSPFPTIVVSPLLSKDDVKVIKEKLKEILQSKTSKPQRDFSNKLLVYIEDSFRNKEELIFEIGQRLIEEGYVKSGFVEAVLKREKKFPTGIESPIPFAIPHAESEYTQKSVIAIILLKKPISFNLASDKNKSILVPIVILPAISNNEEDGILLYKVIEKLNNLEIAKSILKLSQPEKISKLLAED
ncbi:BglG family transcription antiterminator [Caldisericum exile]|uniref:Transcriptional regulator n=1 Tax=Caldisericum exile (strain DSM 21853 / NBRC 104410 / AZM16c01) TaxID=511051 RepID=A0A7U6GFT0_CALEA|nr:PRD domain-containing protein [Caldisericum exile]BAL81580.1 putative transcriptional regulator [Caldisericum exile AZM16c01]